MVGKKVCSTEWKSETLKYPFSSTVATLNHFLSKLITDEEKAERAVKKD